jgi:hypothetical protein
MAAMDEAVAVGGLAAAGARWQALRLAQMQPHPARRASG